MYSYDNNVMCPSGYILRKGYKTRRGTTVKPSCIKNRGKPGKGPKLFPKLKKGLLTEYGYSSKDSLSIRHRALKRAMKAYGKGNLANKLNSVYILNRNTNPRIASIFKKDQEWVSSQNSASLRRSPRRRSTKRRSTKRRSRRRSRRRSTKRRSRRRSAKRRSAKRRSRRRSTKRRSRSIRRYYMI